MFNNSRLMSLALLFTVLIFKPAFLLASPQIYVYKEPDGTIRFTDRKPGVGVEAKVYTAKKMSFTYYKSGVRYSVSNRFGWSPKLFLKKYETNIKDAADEYKLDAALIKAVIHAESSFNPRAISPKGAIGLMQLMPGTARDLGVRPHIAEENIEGGAKYLSYLLKKFGGNLSHAVAAYNAGEENVRKFNGIPPFYETKNYVRRVLALKERYSLHG